MTLQAMEPEGVDVQEPQGAAMRWMAALGFRCDPFAHVFSESDPHLHEYWVRTRGSLTSHEANVLVFGTVGSGKSAKRLRLLDDHRRQPGLLPISILIPSRSGADTVLSESDLHKELSRAWAESLFVYCLQHGTPQMAADPAFLQALGRFLDAWLPLSRWRMEVLDARRAHSWPELLVRLDAANVVAQAGGISVLEGAAQALPAEGDGPVPNLLPADVTKVVVMADDFDADPRRSPQAITDLAVHIWAWRRRGPFGAHPGRKGTPAVAVQLFLPVSVRSKVLRRTKGQPEAYDILWTADDFDALIARRLAFACPSREVSLDWLLTGSTMTQRGLVEAAQGCPRALIVLIHDALLERALTRPQATAEQAIASSAKAPSVAIHARAPGSRREVLA